VRIDDRLSAEGGSSRGAARSTKQNPQDAGDSSEGEGGDVAEEVVAKEAVSWEVEGRNEMVEEEPYMNLVQWLVVDEAGVGLKGAKVTIGTGGGNSSVVVAHLTTDKNGVATIRLPWAA
jgi:hypothetical protein